MADEGDQSLREEARAVLQGAFCQVQETSARDGTPLSFPAQFVAKLLDAAWRCQFDFDRSYDDFKREASGLIASLAAEPQK